jgi:multicomponent K+:H+ antiporter subunit E
MMRAFARRVSPVLVLGLAALWLALNQTLSLGQVVLGLALGALLSWATSTLRPLQARVRRLDLALLLAMLVLLDMLRSNLNVARVVLGLTGSRSIRSAFVDIPLEMKDPHGLAALAVIITSIPGTVWVGLSADGGSVRIHVLDLTDEARMIHLVKERYERRLMRIFE